MYIYIYLYTWICINITQLVAGFVSLGSGAASTGLHRISGFPCG